VETGRHHDGGINGALNYDLIQGGGSAPIVYERGKGIRNTADFEGFGFTQLINPIDNSDKAIREA
jgi:hypothetical protein